MSRLAAHPWSAPLAAALLAVLIYWPIIHHGFIYDDVAIVQEDTRLADPSFGLTLWGAQWWPEGTWVPISRPLTTFTFWLQTQIHGREPVDWAGQPVNLFHVLDLVIFAGLCAALAVLVRRWTTSVAAAWAVGLVFAAHPIHVEVVAGIVGRSETLAALFTALGLIGYLKWRDHLTWWRVILLALAVAAAGLSKEQGYLLAVMYGVVELSRRREQMVRIFARPWPWRLIMAIILVALLAVVQRQVMRADSDRPSSHVPDMDNPLVTAEGWEEPITRIKLVGKAAQMIVAPISQSPDYSPRMLMPTDDLTDPLVITGILAIVIWCGLFVWAWRRRSPTLGMLGLMPIAWAIPSNVLMLIGTIFGERLLTMLSMVTMIAAGGLAVEMGRTLSRHSAARIWIRRTLAGGAATAAIVGYAFATVMYLPAWRDMDTLLVYTVSNHPTSGRYQGFLARRLLDRGLRNREGQPFFFNEAEHHARLALEYWPRNSAPYEVLGVVAYERGDKERGEQYLRYARRASVKLNLADHYLAMIGEGTQEKALEQRRKELEAHLETQPDDTAAWRELAKVYLDLKKWVDAVEAYDRVVTPQTRDLNLLEEYLEALTVMGRRERALEIYEQWLAIRPDQWSMLTDAALTAISIKEHLDDAERWLRRAMRLSPGSAEPWAAMAMLHDVRGEHELAMQAIGEALRRSPRADPKHLHYRLLAERLARHGE